MEPQNYLDGKKIEVTQITNELTIKRENEATFDIQKEKMKVENDLDRKELGVDQLVHVIINDEYQCIGTETADTVSHRIHSACNGKFEVGQITHELNITSENGGVFEIKEEKIEAENDFSREFGVAQITQVFIKDDFNQSIDTDAPDTVLDRFYNAHNMKANVDHAFMRVEETGEEALKRQDKKIKLEKDTDTSKYKITKNSDQVTIKNENDVQRFTNEKTEIILNSTTNGHDFTNPWIKCEAVEELKLESDLDIESYGVAEITEEYIIKNEDDYIVKYPSAAGSHMLNICNHCNVTFKKKRSLDDHIIKQHPDMTAEVSRKIYACTHCEYRTIRNDHLARHMLKHPGPDSGYKLKKCMHCNRGFRWKTSLDDHIINKHPEYIALVLSKIHECKYCIFKTTSKFNLNRHMRTHPGAEGGCQLEMCIHCKAMFRYKISLDDHIIKKHPEYIGSVSSKIYDCKYCVFKSISKRNVTKHMRKHQVAQDTS
ncbi:unnamed protein product [Acanthoscelides obtectus]|uniref:C2H2-type domain-containing protein n=1 Tax=Acanthoscelides obtectus TaxID=200917 RepID=A0A9P0KID5_ACAOB|nr:unnamed protein product [Acanthoscelides obtectus]CAK1664822.1 Zinc finger Y-chromosomal protein [Acanthoscelides obtectus]